FVVDGINLDLLPEGGEIRLDGTITSGVWGNWKATGSYTQATEAGGFTLTTTQPVHVTQAMLNSLPLVPEDTWKEVQLEGNTPGELTVRYDPAAKKVHYRFALQPKDTTVRV